MTSKTIKGVLFVLAVFLLGLMTSLWWFDNKPKQQVSLTSSTLLTPAKPLADFSLTFHDGKPFDLKSLKGQWTWLFFGYSFCPDVCPTTLATVRQAYLDIAENGEVNLPQVVFVSVDPERDTLKQLKQYVEYFNPKFKSATGEKKSIDQLTRQLGILYLPLPKDEGKDYYLVDHSASILLINPKGQLQAIHGIPHSKESLVSDYKEVLRVQG